MRFPALLALALGSLLAAEKKPATIEASLRDQPAHARTSVTWSPDGKKFAYVEDKKLWTYEVRSGKRHQVIDLGELEEAAVKPDDPEIFDWTNRRVSALDRQWFSSGKQILVSSRGDLFLLDVDKGKFEQLTRTSATEADPKLSPDNKLVSFRRGHDLYCLEIASKKVTRLTMNGSDTLLNGELDWVYPEELELGTAHWWSPDSKSVAYLQLDISGEPVYPQVSLQKTRAQLEPERYPQPGDPNAEARVGIVPAQGGETKWMDFGEPRNNLIARVTWFPSSQQVAVEKLNRVQNTLDLLAADATTGRSHSLLRESDKYWVNVFEEPRFLEDGKHFLWSSERAGFRHLFLYTTEGKLENAVTSGEWLVEGIAGVDQQERKIFYTSTEDNPTQRQLYSIGFDGKDKTRLTKGAGTHQISMSPGAGAYLDTFSSLASPPETTLRSSDGVRLATYREADRKDLEEYNILPAEIVKFNTPDGALIYGKLIKPSGFTVGKKYPVIVNVYGGPHAQTVLNQWAGVDWNQVYAQKGFVVWQMDNRGSSGRGHAWESQVYHKLGAVELEDQKAGIQYLSSLGFADTSRMGMFGWSYGGFMTIYALTHAPGLFKAGVAGAPVTDWRNYDTIYTERYMGIPSENEAGYHESALLASAGGLNSKLMIVHNIEDDNVHFSNSLQMANALQKAGKKFQMLIYPQKTHGVTGPVTRQMRESITDFFEENLK